MVSPCAGVCVCGEFDWQTPGQVAQQVATNLMGSLTVTKQVLVMGIVICYIMIITVILFRCCRC